MINTFTQQIPLSAKGVHKICKKKVSDRQQASDKARHNEEGNIQQTPRRNWHYKNTLVQIWEQMLVVVECKEVAAAHSTSDSISFTFDLEIQY